MKEHRCAPEHDARFGHPVARSLRDHHQAHRERRDDAAHDGMLQVGPERVVVRREAKHQKADHDEADHGTRRLAPARERQGVLEAPAQTRNAERETSERRGQATNLVVKLFEHRNSQEKGGITLGLRGYFGRKFVRKRRYFQNRSFGKRDRLDFDCSALPKARTSCALTTYCRPSAEGGLFRLLRIECTFYKTFNIKDRACPWQRPQLRDGHGRQGDGPGNGASGGGRCKASGGIEATERHHDGGSRRGGRVAANLQASDAGAHLDRALGVVQRL